MVCPAEKETRLFQEQSTEKKICKRSYISIFNDLSNETKNFRFICTLTTTCLALTRNLSTHYLFSHHLFSVSHLVSPHLLFIPHLFSSHYLFILTFYLVATYLVFTLHLATTYLNSTQCLGARYSPPSIKLPTYLAPTFFNHHLFFSLHLLSVIMLGLFLVQVSFTGCLKKVGQFCSQFRRRRHICRDFWYNQLLETSLGK